MFFLFGWGGRTTEDLGPTLPAICPNCSNHTWFRLLSSKAWFSVFFISLIPYDSKMLLACPVCARGLELNAEQVEAAMELRRLAAAYAGQAMLEQDYREAAEEVKLLPAIVRSSSVPIEPDDALEIDLPSSEPEPNREYAPAPVLKLVLFATAALVVASIFLWVTAGSVRR